MPAEWHERKLRHLASYLNRGATPYYTGYGGIIVINQKCIRDQRICFEYARRTDPRKKPINPDRMLRKWDIVINSTGVGTLGRVAQVTSVPEPMTVDSHVTIVRPNQKVVDARFLGLAIRALEAEVEALGEGSTGQTELSRSRLAELRILLPPIGEQRAIAHILGTLDDKIELNRKTAATLEAMARALFEAWFVDFEPVRAKMEGRWRRGESLPGLPAHLFDLFPDRLVDTDQGEIPEGWRWGTVSDICDVIGGSTPDTQNPIFWTNGIHYWATPKDLARLSIPILLTTERLLTDVGLSKVGSGLLPVGTVLFSSRAPIGYLAVVAVPVSINQGFVALRAKENVSPLFVMALIKEKREEITSQANGSTFPEISKTQFRQIPSLTPSVKVLEAFRKWTECYLEDMIRIAQESRTLEALRDALLPKLVSGELRVKDAERFLAERGL